MSTIGSVSTWLRELCDGDETNFGKLFIRFRAFLLSCSQENLDKSRCRVFDAEDIAMEAFESFYQGFKRGKFPDLTNRHGLLALFATITMRKAINRINFECAAKRGGGDIQGESAIAKVYDSYHTDLKELDLADLNPTPDEQAIMNDLITGGMNSLPRNLRDIAQKLIVGSTPKQIADELGCSKRTIELKRRRIHDIWARLANE